VPSRNLEIARRAIDAWNEGDIDGLAALLAPEAEFSTFRSQLEGDAYIGPSGVRQFARDAAEEWDHLRIADPELREVGDDHVLALGLMEGRGRVSGADLRVPAAWVIEIRDGRITALRAYSKRDEALAAVGLREW
jgi:ketosteroid isomerase-like protein